jgi:hypothetical protein
MDRKLNAELDMTMLSRGDLISAGANVCTIIRENIKECEPVASETPLVPWSSRADTGWPCPNWATVNGLKLNALLYAAAQHSRVDAVKMYLDAGADPLCQTYNGDCAARIGIANGMISLLDRPDWMSGRIQCSGETGLFALARDGKISDLKHAYAMGADPNVENTSGKTVLQLLDVAFEREIREIIAKVKANILRQATQVATSITASACPRKRL